MVIYHKDVLKILNIADSKTLQTKHNCEWHYLQRNVLIYRRYSRMFIQIWDILSIWKFLK